MVQEPGNLPPEQLQSSKTHAKTVESAEDELASEMTDEPATGTDVAEEERIENDPEVQKGVAQMRDDSGDMTTGPNGAPVNAKAEEQLEAQMKAMPEALPGTALV